MDLAFRVVQSSSILHGVHWGKFLPDTECLIVVKAHLLEAFQLSQDEKPLYCMLEQTLGFQVAASTMFSKSDKDYLMVTTDGIVHFLEFVDDYFKIQKSGETGLKHIEKIKCFQNSVICSDNQKNLIVLESKNLSIVQKFDIQGSIIDWKILDSVVLVLEYDCAVKNCLWEQIDIVSGQRKTVGMMQDTEDFPRCFVNFKGLLMVFSEEKMTVVDSLDFKVTESRTLKGFYSSSTIILDKLFICMDDGSVYTYESKLLESEIKLQEDSWILNISNFLFFISHHGQSGIYSSEFAQISRNFRSGNFIDGFFQKSWDDTGFNCLVCASVNFNSSELIKIQKRTFDIYQQLNVPDACKYTTNASVASGYLFLMPDLKAVNMSTFEMVSISSLNLVNEHTLAVWSVGEVLWQITEKSIFCEANIKYSIDDPCSAAYYKENIIVAGLITQKILILDHLVMKREIFNVDFSALYLTDNFELLVGLQQSGIQKYSLNGDLQQVIETKGIPQSYSEHFGKLFVGTRDGVLQVFGGNEVFHKKLGHNPLNLSKCSKGVLAVAGKGYLIFNEKLDVKRINLPDSKLMVESEYFVSVSKDLIFFSIEEDLRFTTTQNVLLQIPGQVNRMIQLNDRLVCFSYFKENMMVLSIFDTISLEVKSEILLNEQVTALIHSPENDLIVVGTKNSSVTYYNSNLEELVTHRFQFEVTSLLSFNKHFLLVASSYILFTLDCTDIYNPIKILCQKFHSIITDLQVFEDYIIMALNLCGVFILNLKTLEVISASRKKLDIKKILIHGRKIFAISIDGWVLIRELEDTTEYLYYTGSGARVLVSGSLYDMNLKGVDQNNITVAGFNGEILELYPSVDKEVCEKARELFKDLQESGIIDSKQTQELNLDILRLMLKLPSLKTKDPLTRRLLEITN